MASTSLVQVIFFHHEQGDVVDALHDLNVRSKTQSQLRYFLNSSSSVVHDQVIVFEDATTSARIGPFEDLMDLAERHASRQQRDVVVEAVLWTTVQIGRLLVLAEENPAIFSGVSVPVGFGFGLIAAAVATAATNINSAVTLGLEGVAVAFRLASQLLQASRDIEDSDGTWACTVRSSTREDVQQDLSKVNAKLRPLQHAYIGQALPGAFVVFGPPSTLDTFRKVFELAGNVDAPTEPFKSLLFAPHLPPIDVSKILRASPLCEASRVDRALYSLHSPADALHTQTFSELLGLVTQEIAHKPVQVEKTFQTLAASILKKDHSAVLLTTVGSTRDISSLQEVFQQHDQTVYTSELPPCPKPFGNDLENIPADAIAVVGMSGRFPESDTLDELWRLLETGTTTHQEIPSSRLNLDDFYDPSRAKHNALVSRYGCFIKKPGHFDHRLFNISPREALQMDPVQRMLLMTTYEALEMAGYSDEDEQAPPRITTYFGQTIDDWKTIQEQQGIDTHFLPAVNRGFAPGRLCHYFKWAGGFNSIDTGCSSSATGICIARDALARGDCDAAVVGGGTLLAAPEWFSGLGQGGFLSPTGACKTYSDQADGYCRGEGVAVVVLKRLADAIRAKDDVLGVIAGAARSTNAGEDSITHPGAKAQETLYRRVLRQGAVRPSEVGVVEMHGTGTQAGDRIETTAVRNVFASSSQPKRQQPLIVGAIKANIGHSEAAAGVVSLIKAILMLHHDKIPPQPNQPFKLNPYLVPILGPGTDMQIANGQAWPQTRNGPRYVFVNNFDAAGGNVSVLLHEAPDYARSQQSSSSSDVRSHHIVVTSGRTEEAQTRNKEKLQDYLLQHPETQLAHLAYTTTARRMHLNIRDAYVATSVSELLQQMGQAANPSVAASSVVFAFTGQGSQYAGMGGMLYRTSATFQRILDSYQRLCDAQGLDCRFLDCLLGSEDSLPANAANTGRDMQVATVAVEIALARYWQSLGISPTLLVGHSLGEYAALCVAGVISVGEALVLAFDRANLIHSTCPASEAGMLAVSLPANTVRWRIRDLPSTSSTCEICCINGPSSTVVGGPVAALDDLEKYLKSDGNVSTSRLRVQYAFHTRQMEPLLDTLEAKALGVAFQAPKIPIASTVLGKTVQPGEGGIFNANYIRRHTREPVAFCDAIIACESEGLIQDQSFVLEIGPHPTCINLMAPCLQKAKPDRYPSLHRGHDDWKSVSQCLAAAYRAQLPVAWAEFHKDQLDCVELISDLPTYAFERQDFWVSYKTSTAQDKSGSSLSASFSKLSSTSLHSIEKVQREGSHQHATFTADLSNPRLAEAISGHVVDGVAICPASIFIDMAYTAAAWLETGGREISSAHLATYELLNLSMMSPLVLRKGMAPDELPQVTVEADFDESQRKISVRFATRAAAATETPVENGSCVIQLEQPDSPSTQAWSRLRPLVQERVQTLKKSSRPKEVHAMDKRLFYKVFSEVVDYAPPYHVVAEAIVASSFRDASFTFESPSSEDQGSFTCSPFAVDAAVHVAGFLLNADVGKPKSDIHIANHIGSLRVLGDLSSSGPWQAYATIREQKTRDGTSLCDVYVTDNQDMLVAVCSDICFKKLDRDFFSLLTGSSRATVQKPRATAQPNHVQPVIRTIESSDVPSPGTSGSSSLSLSSQSEPDDLAAELLSAVATRSGVSVSELKRGAKTTFTDSGVDSQMSIQILADFQNATAVELPAAFFSNFPTVADVEKELGISPLEDLEPKPKVKSPVPPVHRSNKQSSAPQQPSDKLFSIVAQALGLDVSTLKPAVTFESIGMDSMLSIKTLASFQQETDIELPAAFFTANPTVARAQDALDGASQEPTPAQKVPTAVDPGSSGTASLSPRQQKIDTAVSRSVLIQGQSWSKAAPLFMTTDGSGTVESYIHLTALPEGRRIYALESPFLGDPTVFDLSIEEMASIFVRTMRRIQPHGPYLIGGWSAGSVYAYEAAHRLSREGEEILALAIIDMRPPSLIPTAIVTPDFVDKLGTFEGINRARDLPEDLSVKEKAHLMATCRALSRYDAPAFPSGRRPKQSTIVWARLGLDQRADAGPAAMLRPGLEIGKSLDEMDISDFENYFNSWFYGKRDKFGTNGWETLLGDDISVYDVDGDHFSMMCPPFSNTVGRVVVDTLARATAGE